MNRSEVLKISNLFLFISMLAQILTGIILFFDLFVMNGALFKLMIEVHKYNGLIITVLIVVHLMLNWGWIRSQFFRRRAA